MSQMSHALANMEAARDAFWVAYAALEQTRALGDAQDIELAHAEVERLRGPYKAAAALWLEQATHNNQPLE